MRNTEDTWERTFFGSPFFYKRAITDQKIFLVLVSLV